MPSNVLGNILIDRLKISKLVEAFYLSGYANGTLPVKINPPISDIFNIKLIRKSSYQETLNDAFYKIHRYLLNHSLITTGDSVTACNSLHHRKHVLQSHISKDFNKYLVNNNLNGQSI